MLLQEVDPEEILLGETILRQRQGEWESEAGSESGAGSASSKGLQPKGLCLR